MCFIVNDGVKIGSIKAAYNAKTDYFTTVSSEDYKGKWTVACFYPADFTFVCPTEIAAMNAKEDSYLIPKAFV
jgi:alkyl hydroperoxide reductase subunit AhpC